MGSFKSLFNKLLGFLLLCLMCSGIVAVVLIRGQMTKLAYTQMHLLFESDFRNVRAFLQGKADWLLAVASELAKDELLKTGLELEVFDQVRIIAENRKTALGLSEVMVINAQKRLVSRGDASREMLDPQIDAVLADKAFGGIELGGRYQMFGQTALSTPDGTRLARVVVMQPLSAAFFQELKAVLGKDAMIFAGTREVGSTFAQPPGTLKLTPVAAGLFTAFQQQFIGTERDLGDVVGYVGWRVVLLEAAAPLLGSLRQVQWGSVLFVLIFMSLMALVLGWFFAANIRRPMRMIQQSIAALTQGNLGTRLHLGRRDEWLLIEEALNRLSTSLEQNAQLQAENLRMGAELDVTRKLQYMLLPTAEELDQIADLDIACYMEPADEVGGDYYDVLQYDGLIKIGIGDVTGHGLESGVLMVMTQAIVRALLANGETDPVRFLATLNRALYGNVQRMGTDKNLTLALLDYEAGEVRLSGQHEHMLVVRGDGTVDVVDTIDLGFPMALTDEIADFIQHTTVHLQPGDGVVLYTDGITEAENLAREQYGLARLCTVVSQHWGAPAEVVKECVVKDVHQYMGAQKMYDDITLVVVKRC
jgi:serine phosphatase RsbU (regulator of sigma subunit)